MDRTYLVGLIACSLLLACSEPESTVTETDAISLGYERVDCSELPGYVIYGAGGESNERAGCGAAVAALELARESGLVPVVAFNPNATGVIVVEPRAVAEQQNESSEMTVTFDLLEYGQNIAVTPSRDGGLPVISWVQEGLRY
jgi:hypothetical protein